MPKVPADKSNDKMISYLEAKVTLMEKKMGILSKLTNQIQLKDKEIKEKNEIIAKLLVLLS